MAYLNPDLTEEERAEALVAFMRVEQERTADRVAKHIMRRATAGFCVLLAGIAGAFYVSGHDQGVARDAIVKSGTVVAVDSCNARYADRAALRDLFFRLQVAVLEQSKAQHLKPSDPDVQFALKFYRDELGRLPLPDCRPTAHILTDQPYPPVTIPRPKHP